MPIDDLNRDTWVRVLIIPGVSESCGQLDHAWVPRDQVVLTPPQPPSPQDQPGAATAE